MKKYLLLLFVSTGLAVGAFAQGPMTATAKAEIVKALVIIDDPLAGAGNALNFGLVNVGSTAGTVVVSTLGAATTGGGVASTSSATAARFSLSGTANKTYAITLPAAAVTINGTSGNALSTGATMTVNSFVSRPVSTGADATTGTLDATGNDNFSIGGTLNVSATQAEGQYSGNFTVSVAYN